MKKNQSLLILLVLLLLSIDLKAQNNNESESDEIYRILSRQLSLTKIKQEQTKISGVSSSVYVSKLPTSIGIESLKTKLANFDSTYSNIHMPSNWFNKTEAIHAKCYNVKSFDSAKGMLVIYYMPEIHNLTITYLKFEREKFKEFNYVVTSLCTNARD